MHFRDMAAAKVKSDSIWDMLKEEMPTQSIKVRAYFLHGLGSLFNLMTASEGYAIVARATFIDHCVEVDPKNMGSFAEFSYYCFKLRVCDNDQVSASTCCLL